MLKEGSVWCGVVCSVVWSERTYEGVSRDALEAVQHVPVLGAALRLVLHLHSPQQRTHCLTM